MRENIVNQSYEHPQTQTEFDAHADKYQLMHKENIAITGELPEYFSEYKIADLAKLLARLKLSNSMILDFGSGIGNSLPFFRKYFPSSNICCADVSIRSIEIAKNRFPGKEKYILIKDSIPLSTGSQDVVFSSCVFHHIPPKQHLRWLLELYRVTKNEGIIVIYEHNPINPFTLFAVRTCPLDVNASLIRSGTMKRTVVKSGWKGAHVDYKLFFPAFLSFLRPIEEHFRWLAFGAQYRLMAIKDSKN